MNYLEYISVSSYALGGFTLIFGLIMNFFLPDSFNGNVEFTVTIILFAGFIVTAMVSKGKADSADNFAKKPS
jgi:hypothetical protein